MTPKGSLQLIALLTILAKCCSAIGEICDNFKLTDSIFRDYDKLARPVTGPVTIGHALELLRVRYLREDDGVGTLAIDVWEDVYWTDPRLSWNTDTCSNFEVRVERDAIWLPQVFTYFGANQPDDKVEGSLIGITPEGLLGYSADKTLVTYCNIPEVFETNDTVTCTITIGSWNYNVDELTFELLTMGGGMSKEYFVDDNKYLEVVNTTSTVVERSFACCPRPFVNIDYTITLKNRLTPS